MIIVNLCFPGFFSVVYFFFFDGKEFGLFDSLENAK